MCLAVHRQTQAQIEKKIDKMTLDSMYARKQAVSIGVKCTIVEWNAQKNNWVD